MSFRPVSATLLASAGALASAAVAMPPAEAWEIGPWVRGKNYSVGMPESPATGPDGEVVVDFPLSGRGEWDALTTGVYPLEGVAQITVRYRIDAAPGTRFVAVETPDQPATVSLYFQQEGDDWSARGRYQSYRWYAPGETVMPLSPGEHTMTVRFDDRWTNVLGKPNDQRAKGFAEALANTQRLGLAFGSASRRSHGVYATGPAQFTLLSIDFELAPD